MFKATEIASFYIQLFNSIPNDYIDNLKLNIILYYAQAWNLIRNNEPIFSDDIQAWDYGPVIPEVYKIYKCCGNNPIREAAEPFDEARLNSSELGLLIDVYGYYGQYTGLALKNMTHKKGTPWDQVYVTDQNNIIPLDVMKNAFLTERLETFDPDSLNIPIVSAIPSSWDSQEDTIYD